MNARRLLDTQALPGVSTAPTVTMADELRRLDLFDSSSRYAGQIVYRARRTKRGTEYGWQDAKAPKNSALLSKTDAARLALARRAA